VALALETAERQKTQAFLASAVLLLPLSFPPSAGCRRCSFRPPLASESLARPRGGRYPAFDLVRALLEPPLALLIWLPLGSGQRQAVRWAKLPEASGFIRHSASRDGATGSLV
jgi:hypothetical protein